jgi:hypothetical protein
MTSLSTTERRQQLKRFSCCSRFIADALYTVSPQGENTLTVRNGRRALAQALAEGKRLDELRIRSDVKGVKEEVEGMIGSAEGCGN